jgi:hypothetical protein
LDLMRERKRCLQLPNDQHGAWTLPQVLRKRRAWPVFAPAARFRGWKAFVILLAAFAHLLALAVPAGT